jgi:drug/metabolite transporter (DMT)-like permease
MGLGEALAIGSALAWSAGVIIYKRLGETMSPLRLNLIKNLLVLSCVAPTVVFVYGFTLPQLSWSTLVLTLLSGAIGIAAADTLYFRALNALGAARMGIMGNLYSPFVILLSFAFLGERLSPLQGLGFVLVSGGVLVVSQRRSSDTLSPAELRQGLFYGATAIVMMAVAIVMVKRILEGQPLLWVVLLRLIGGVLGLFVMFAWKREPLLPRGPDVARLNWRVIAAGAFFGQYVSMVMWLGGYKYTSASVAAILNETASVFIVLMAAAFLHEGLNARKLVGVSLTLSGVGCMLLA